ncbi:MAG: hypothetical protein LBT21_04825 [Oscillospiraceae bacterium]|jgi:hypothetical protein|nr:hypothetical protein [Oscillospiraceae bacterium]
MTIIQDLYNAFQEWFAKFGSTTDYDWSALNLDGLWGSLLQKIAEVFVVK